MVQGEFLGHHNSADDTGLLISLILCRNILKVRRNEKFEQEDLAESLKFAVQPGKPMAERMLPPPVPVKKIAPRRSSSPRKGEERGRGFWVGYRTRVTDMESYHDRWKARSAVQYDGIN